MKVGPFFSTSVRNFCSSLSHVQKLECKGVLLSISTGSSNSEVINPLSVFVIVTARSNPLLCSSALLFIPSVIFCLQNTSFHLFFVFVVVCFYFLLTHVSIFCDDRNFPVHFKFLFQHSCFGWNLQALGVPMSLRRGGS